MSTFLLTWNAKTWPWDPRDFARLVRRTAVGTPFRSWWSAGNTKRIEPGDRLFLLRQGTERGIIGAGFATSPCYSGCDRRRDLRVRYLCHALLPVEQRLPLEKLISAVRDVPWNAIMASGLPVSEESAAWRSHLKRIGCEPAEAIGYPRINRAISIRQPYAEAVMRGNKNIEYRSIPTNIRGRFYIYAGLRRHGDDDVWMKKYTIHDVNLDDLARGVILGTVEFWKCDYLKGEWR